MSKTNNNNSIASVDFDSTLSRRVSKLSWLLSLFPIGSKEPVIAVLHLNGVIGKVSAVKSGLCIESLNDLIERAFAIKNLTAVCLTINSPGGSPAQSDLIAKRIRALAKENEVPVYSFIEDVAASGGYWLACIGDKIYATSSSIIGSIGVISAGFGLNEAIKKLGVERRVYAEGKNKSILDPFQPAQEEDIRIIKHLQKQIHENFIDYVKERRAGKLTQDDNILFNGEFWAGQTAVDYGLIDGIDDMYNFINQKYGKAKIKHIFAKQSWIKKNLGMVQQSFAKSLTDNFIESIDNKVNYDMYKVR